MITKLLSFLFEFLVPRFIEEWVMLEEKPDSYHPVCSYLDIQEGETFDAMCKAKSITWFGFCFFPRFSNPVPFSLEEINK